MDPSSRSLGPPTHHGHAHFWERAVSRGQFIRTAAGVGAGTLSAGLWLPSVAQAAKPVSAAPSPIPGTTVFIPGTPAFHANPPATGVDVATITNFNGIVGVAHVTGTGTGTDTSGNSALTFDADMRFMQGLYTAVDGHNYQATFGFIWLDLFEGSGSSQTQIHDFNPGIAFGSFPDGVFWTVLLPDSSVQVNLGHAAARMALTNYAIPDYQNFPNFAANGPSLPGMVSFDLRWSGGGQRVKDVNPAQGYAADFIYDTAAIAWSGQQGSFTFTSDPASTSTSQFAALGKERNGRFFPQGGGG